MADLDWTKLGERSEKVGYRTLTLKLFRQPSGAELEYTTWCETGVRSVATVAITKDGKIVIARQYRPGPETILEEIPGGNVDVEDKDLASAAARELVEETGYVSDEPLEYLGFSYADAYTNNTNHFFLARNCYRGGMQELDATEFVEIDTISAAQFVQNAKSGKMTDTSAVLMALDALAPYL
jgi:ADP-ribose pyrophosphatase